MTYDSDKLKFTVKPTVSDIGSYNMTLRCSDDFSSANFKFKFLVKNRPPQLKSSYPDLRFHAESINQTLLPKEKFVDEDKDMNITLTLYWNYQNTTYPYEYILLPLGENLTFLEYDPKTSILSANPEAKHIRSYKIAIFGCDTYMACASGNFSIQIYNQPVKWIGYTRLFTYSITFM